MQKVLIVLVIAAACLTGCKKYSSPASSGPADAVQQKLQELAGNGATDCGRLQSQAQNQDAQLTSASNCAMQAAKSKHAFYVAYDMPGMTVGVAGNADGKLFALQSVQPENAPPSSAPEVKTGPCPAELRVAQSGRVTCFTPGSMGLDTGSSPHGGMPMPPATGTNPHGGMEMPEAGSASSHASGTAMEQ